MISCIIFSWIIGTILIHYFERAQGWSFFDAFYYTIIMTATIGLGDMVPLSTPGKVLTIIYAMIYVPLFPIVMGYMIEHRMIHIIREENEIKKKLSNILIQQEEIITKEEVEAIIGETIESSEQDRPSGKK